MHTEEARNFEIRIDPEKRPDGAHPRTYNAPQTSEVAAIIPGPESGPVGDRTIVVRTRGGRTGNNNEVLHEIKWNHRSYDPLSYVLLFPNGRDGWHSGLRMVTVDQESKEAHPVQ